MDELAPKTPPAVMPGVDEVSEAYKAYVALLSGRPQELPLLQEVAACLVTGDASVWPDMSGGIREQYLEAGRWDGTLADILTEINMRCMLPSQEYHGGFWRFYNAAKVVMAEHSMTNWELLRHSEQVRHQIARMCMTPEEVVNQLKTNFTTTILVSIALTVYLKRREHIDLMNRVAGCSWTYGFDGKREEYERLPGPSVDDYNWTAAVKVLSEQELPQVQVNLRTAARNNIDIAARLVTQIWGAGACEQIADLLTEDHFLERVMST